MSVCVARACDLFANLPGPVALKIEATPASPPTFAEQYPAVCDQCRKWKENPLVLSGENCPGSLGFPLFFCVDGGKVYRSDSRLPEVNKPRLTGERAGYSE